MNHTKTHRIKVCNIIEEGRLGGPQIRIAEVAKQLLDYAVETIVIFPKYQSDLFKQRLVEYNIKHFRLPLNKLTREKTALLKYAVYFMYEIILLCRLFRKENFDIIHCSGGAWQWKGLIAGKITGAKTIWHLNDTSMPASIILVFRFFARFFADGFILAGNRVKQYYLNKLDMSAKPISEIQAPVSTHHFDPIAVPADRRIDHQKGLKIISVGNLNPLKGFEFFIQMAHRLNQTHKDLTFYIIGAHFDSQRAYIRKLKRLVNQLNLKNLIFFGICSDTRQALKAGDIYVCSSISEASPISVWEAMSMGNAIVSSDVGDVSRFITNGENGFVVPIEDADSLAEKVDVFIRNPHLRKQMGTRARAVAIQELDLPIVSRNHLEAYHGILNRDLFT